MGVSNDIVVSTSLVGLGEPRSGKVRDMYSVGADHVLMVATDRISAFDVIMGEGIPGKGRVLTALSKWWFARTADLVPNHVVATEPSEIEAAVVAAGGTWEPWLAGRSILCRRAQPLPVEAVVRGYLSGSAWKEYRRTGGDLWGYRLPGGFHESAKLPEPMFTPSTKAKSGHDMPLTPTEAMVVLGNRFAEVEAASLRLYQFAAALTAEKGILLADTKFEFGIDANGALILIDEVLTPDSSRFWPADNYSPGGAQPSFDKQFLRDYLETIPDWNKQAPAPALPAEVIAATASKYQDAYRRITGEALPAGD